MTDLPRSPQRDDAPPTCEWCTIGYPLIGNTGVHALPFDGRTHCHAPLSRVEPGTPTNCVEHPGAWDVSCVVCEAVRKAVIAEKGEWSLGDTLGTPSTMLFPPPCDVADGVDDRLSSGTPAGSEDLFTLPDRATRLASWEDGDYIETIDQLRAALRSAQERVTTLTAENAGLAASWEFELLRADRTAAALAVSQAREREAVEVLAAVREIAEDAGVWRVGNAEFACQRIAQLTTPRPPAARSVDGGTPT